MWNNSKQNQKTCWPGYIGIHRWKIGSYVADVFFSYLRNKDLEKETEAAANISEWF